MKYRLIYTKLFVLSIFVSGCSQIDPLYRKDLWNSNSSNAKNLQLQLDNQRDLEYGRSESEHDVVYDSNAIKRLREGKVKSLPSSNVSSVGAGSSVSGGQGQ